jgi:hypothetical protein
VCVGEGLRLAYRIAAKSHASGGSSQYRMLTPSREGLRLVWVCVGEGLRLAYRIAAKSHAFLRARVCVGEGLVWVCVGEGLVQVAAEMLTESD